MDARIKAMEADIVKKAADEVAEKQALIVKENEELKRLVMELRASASSAAPAEIAGSMKVGKGHKVASAKYSFDSQDEEESSLSTDEQCVNSRRQRAEVHALRLFARSKKIVSATAAKIQPCEDAKHFHEPGLSSLLLSLC